jgi:hypothetical protein
VLLYETQFRIRPENIALAYCYGAHVSLLRSVDADFFLAGIAPDFAWIGDPLGSCFLNPGTHFILVLLEPVAAKDVAPCERGWRRLLEPLPDMWIICSFGVPPRYFQRVA